MQREGILTYDAAFDLLSRYGNGTEWKNHCVAVAKVAMRLGELLSSVYALDAAFLRTASLLHDIGRHRTHDPILHGVEGYYLLTGLGHHREAFVCISHIMFGLTSDEAVQYGLPEEDFVPRTFEEQLVPVIDSLVEGDRPVTIEQRLASIRSRYRGNDYFLARIEEGAIKVREMISHIRRDSGVSLETVVAEVLS
ncbi:MAG: HD domain-containing protein [Nitrospirota bacterium]